MKTTRASDKTKSEQLYCLGTKMNFPRKRPKKSPILKTKKQQTGKNIFREIVRPFGDSRTSTAGNMERVTQNMMIIVTQKGHI